MLNYSSYFFITKDTEAQPLAWGHLSGDCDKAHKILNYGTESHLLARMLNHEQSQTL